MHIRAKKRSRYGVAEWRREESIEEEGGDGVEGVIGFNVAVHGSAVGGPTADEANFDKCHVDGVAH